MQSYTLHVNVLVNYLCTLLSTFIKYQRATSYNYFKQQVISSVNVFKTCLKNGNITKQNFFITVYLYTMFKLVC